MPHFARVIGTIWATQKYPDLDGASLRLIQPCNSRGEAIGEPIAAVDTEGAGPGEMIFYVTAYEAVIPYPKDLVPIDASIVGIVENIHLDPTE